MLLLEDLCVVTKPTPPVMPKQSAEQIPIPAKAMCHPSSMATRITCSNTAIVAKKSWKLANQNLSHSEKNFSMCSFSWFSLLLNSGSPGWELIPLAAILENWKKNFFWLIFNFPMLPSLLLSKNRLPIFLKQSNRLFNQFHEFREFETSFFSVVQFSPFFGFSSSNVWFCQTEFAVTWQIHLLWLAKRLNERDFFMLWASIRPLAKCFWLVHSKYCVHSVHSAFSGSSLEFLKKLEIIAIVFFKRDTNIFKRVS